MSSLWYPPQQRGFVCAVANVIVPGSPSAISRHTRSFSIVRPTARNAALSVVVSLTVHSCWTGPRSGGGRCPIRCQGPGRPRSRAPRQGALRGAQSALRPRPPGRLSPGRGHFFFSPVIFLSYVWDGTSENRVSYHFIGSGPALSTGRAERGRRPGSAETGRPSVQAPEEKAA